MSGTTDEDLIRKRRCVGILAGACLAVSAAAFVTGSLNTGWSASFFRIGIVLGALWIALPTRTRPAAWARMSKWSLAAIIALAVLLPRLKWFLPVLIAGIGIGWLLRPKTWRR